MIRGTVNESIKSTVREVVGEGIALGPNAGINLPNENTAGAVEYREIDNATPGVTFKHARDHILRGTAQVTTNT